MTYLYQTTVVPGDKQLSIVTNKAASRDVLKSRDGLGDFLYTRGIYMHSSSCCDRISIWFGVCEMDRSDGSVFLDKDRVFKRSPVTRFYAMFFWSRFCVFTWDDRLVIHTAATQSERISFFHESRAHKYFSSIPLYALVLRPPPFASPIATKCCCFQIFLLEMKCSPTRSPCSSPVVVFPVTSPLISPCSKVVDNVVYEVDCAMITVKEGADVDIGLSFLSISLLCLTLKISL